MLAVNKDRISAQIGGIAKLISYLRLHSRVPRLRLQTQDFPLCDKEPDKSLFSENTLELLDCINNCCQSIGGIVLLERSLSLPASKRRGFADIRI